MSQELNTGDVFIDDTPVDFSFVKNMTDEEYDSWIKSGCPEPNKNI